MATTAKAKRVRVTKQQIQANRRKKKKPFSFDGWETMDAQEFGKLQRAAIDHYYSELKTAELMTAVYHWMKENGYSKKEIASAKKGYISPTVGTYCQVMLDGCPDYNPAYAEYWEALPGTGGTLKPHSEYIHVKVKEAISKGEKIVDVIEEEIKKPSAPVLTIQDRLRIAASNMVEDIEELVDQFISDPDTFDPKRVKLISLLRGKGAKAAHARFIKSFYESQLAEYQELLSILGKKPIEEDQIQLLEGYSQYGKKNIKKMHDFLVSLMDACDQIAAEDKLNRAPRKKRVKSADEKVAKMQFKKSDDKLAITSVPPDQIVSASAVVVYNTKTRKLGYYIAADISGLDVKGTTLQNFTVMSVQKTLRKPELQLREFKEQNTKKRFEKWFKDSIKTTEIKLNGRTNADTIILKVFK